MNVLYINDVYSVGGATKALGELVCEIKKMGIEPIVCNSRRDSFNEYLDSIGITNYSDGHLGAMDVKVKAKNRKEYAKMFHIEKKRYKEALKQAIEFICCNIDLASIDIIHTNSARNDVGCVLSKKYGIPHVMHLREFGQEDFDCCTYRFQYYRYLNKNCDRILAVSDAVRESWIKKGIKPEKCETVLDGVDFSNFRIKEDYNYTDTLRMCLVGGICETKGQNIAVESFDYLPDRIKKNIVLDIIGWDDPVHLQYLKEQISAKGLLSNISFLGEKKDVGGILSQYDVGLMCSKSEGFGRVTVEYMYSGLGVIAANTGACPELIEHGKTGLLFERNNSKTLASCIERFYYDRDLLYTCGTNAHKLAKERFSAERNAKEIFSIYWELLENNGDNFS